MSEQTVSYRKVRAAEVPELWRKMKEKYPWAAEPAWEGVYVKTVGGQIRAMWGLQQKCQVEPLDADEPIDARDAIAGIAIALAMTGIKQFEFFVPNENERFQQAIEKHYGIEGHTEMPGKYYFVKLE